MYWVIFIYSPTKVKLHSKQVAVLMRIDGAVLQNIYKKTEMPHTAPLEGLIVDMQDSNLLACLAAGYQLASNKYRKARTMKGLTPG